MGFDECVQPHYRSWQQPGQSWFVGPVQIWKKFASWKYRTHYFPTGLWWSLYMPVSLPVFNWSPFTDALFSSTSKCLNVQGQVAVLGKTGGIWISRNPRWREKKRMKSCIWFIGSRFISGMLSGWPYLLPHSAVSRETIRGTLSIPTTQKIKPPLQAARQKLVFKPLTSKPDRDVYYHIWKQLLHSQGVTDKSWARRRWFCSFYCLKGCNLTFVRVALKPTKNITKNSIKIQYMSLGMPPRKYRGREIPTQSEEAWPNFV